MLKGKISLIMLVLLTGVFIAGIIKIESQNVLADDQGTFNCVADPRFDLNNNFQKYDVVCPSETSSCSSTATMDSAKTDTNASIWNPSTPYTNNYPSGCSAVSPGDPYSKIVCTFNCISSTSTTLSYGDVCNPNSNKCSLGLDCRQDDGMPVPKCLKTIGSTSEGQECISYSECSGSINCRPNSTGQYVCGGGDINLGGQTITVDGVSGFGASCIPSTAKCVGKQNLVNAINNGHIKLNGLTTSQLYKSISSTFLGDPNSPKGNVNEMCAINDVRQIISVAYVQSASGPIELNAPSENLGGYSGDAKYAFSARYCSNGYTAQKQTSRGGAGTYDIWNCCPSNYIAVGYAAAMGSSTVTADPVKGGCCRIPSFNPSPGTAGYPNSAFNSGGTTKCLDSSGTEISYTDGPPAGLTNFLERHSAIGSGLGNSSNNLNLEKNSGALLNCPTDDGCAVVTNSNGVTSDSITSKSRSYTIISSGNLKLSTAQNIACQKCYANGEAMFIEDPGSVNGNKTSLIVCDGKSIDTNTPEHFVTRSELINNSVADTIAVLNAKDDTNGEFIESCRARGGIPTGVGCLDPSPLGIITWLIRVALGVVGGVALLELILVGVQYQRGDEEGIKKARERLISTLTGVAVLVFSVLILRILGVNILDILPTGSV